MEEGQPCSGPETDPARARSPDLSWRPLIMPNIILDT